MKPFELYEPQRSTSSGRGVPVVRVLSGGRLVLNAAGARLLAGTTHVQLLWDAVGKKIGFRPTDGTAPGSFRVTFAPSQAVITSKGFIDEHQLRYSRRMRLDWEGDILTASTELPEADPE